MGCATSVAVRTIQITRDKKDKTPHRSQFVLSEEQKHVVRFTWKLLSDDMAGHGAKIFLRIFQLDPQIKMLFPFCDIEGEELLQHITFKGHAARFMQAVGAAVENVDGLDKALRPLLIDIGRQHVKFKGYRPNFFHAFTEAMMETWHDELGDKFTEFAQEAWNSVFSFIIDTMKEGFFMALTEANMSIEDV